MVTAVSPPDAGQDDVLPGGRELADLDLDQRGRVAGERLLEGIAWVIGIVG